MTPSVTVTVNWSNGAVHGGHVVAVCGGLQMMLVADLFSGIGGFSLGLEMTGHFETVAFCENSTWCKKVLKKHWPAVPIYDDIRRLEATDLAGVDVLTGGFPCQDISSSGGKDGIDGQQSGLWAEYARLICDVRPAYAIVENVSALLVRGMGTVLADLARIGYDSEWCSLSAAQFGAPHLRNRVWLVAYPRCQPTQIPAGRRFAAITQPDGIGWWETEPPPLRMDDGLPRRLDRYNRLKGLGNAVVPHIVAHIGRQIIEWEQQKWQ